jgi:5-methyltetrahydropteroyltriglutamate--homocysteine methyltransferase
LKTTADRLLTTHVGRLQRPDLLTEQMDTHEGGRPADEAFHRHLRDAVQEVVRDQVATGVDIVSDGEFGKLSWHLYLRTRLSGFEPNPNPVPSILGHERVEFKEYYDWADAEGQKMTYFKSPGKNASSPTPWLCTGPIRYIGHDDLQEDIGNLAAAAAAADATEAFMPATAPGSTGWTNGYYASEEEYLFALADALREEYVAIVEAGLVLHIDDPFVPNQWAMMLPDADVEQYHRVCMPRVEALNHALRGIPEDRVRVHICWGSWHGPHTTDAPLPIVMPLLLKMNVGGYVFEAANARHEHEWEVWRDVDLPEDRVLIPGVVSHATATVEHPELISRRLCNFASIVGRERVIAGTDCGLGYRVHPQIAWAKLRALAEGAELASRTLWGAFARSSTARSRKLPLADRAET